MKSRHRIAISALFTILSPVLVTVILFSLGVLKNVNPDDFKTSVVSLDRWFLSNYHEAAPKVESETEVIEPAAPDEKTFVTCDYEKPAQPLYGASVVSARKEFRVLPDKFFETRVYLENTGNVPWFSDDAACGQNFRLGTTRETDRESIFYSPSFVDENLVLHPSGWVAKNRIKMETLRVDPGEVGEFVFQSRAPHPSDVYLEYFAPVIESVAWLENSEFIIPIHVGDFSEDTETLEMKLMYLKKSMKTSEADFSGGKIIEIDLSDQKMSVRIGNHVIREFLISSGQPYSHPTPRGNFEILFKQQVRIGGAPPFYIMPKWQAFKWNGYGLHGLPSLGSASVRAKIREYGPDEQVPLEVYNNDVMWTEAVEHVGRPVSHGCVRMGPEDADFLYDFTDIGTPVVIHD